MAINIDSRHIQGVGRNIGSIHTRAGQCQRRRDRDTTRTRPDIEYARDRIRIDPRSEVPFDQLSNRRTRHEHSPVHVELVTAKPHPAGEIGSGNALIDTTPDEFHDRGFRFRRSLVRIRHRRVFMPEPGTEEHQFGGFVQRVVGTMTETHLGGPK